MRYYVSHPGDACGWSTMAFYYRKLKYVNYRRVKYFGLTVGVLVLLALTYLGVFTHLLEKDFYTEFHYPMDGDITEYVMQLRAKRKPSVEPINVYNYSFVSSCERKCAGVERLQLVYIVKSAVGHSARRRAIRETWGFEGRFSDVSVRTVFVLGVQGGFQAEIQAEQAKYGDIVQADFLDTYFNNTIKTMMGFTWAVTYCPQSRFYLFSDDDMYVSTKNVLRFVRNPTRYPSYLEEPVSSLGGRQTQFSPDFELPEDVKLYAGFGFSSAPHRTPASKWYVPLSEYPYHLWPPYVTAGAYVLSREALMDMFYASHFTQHFRFDDVYLGLVASKADVQPFHCDDFHFYKKPYDVYGYRYVVASHGYGDAEEMIRVWNEQKGAGNA